jgi:hypothetical protein
VSDTHIGSLYEHSDILHLAYKIFREEGITTVYHPGDICEGEKMYRGQEYEIYAHGADNQVDACCERYPQFKGITTYFIEGSHDLSFYKHSGTDIGPKIFTKRPDLVCLGREEADTLIQTKHGEIILRLVHPGRGSAYALSYHVQKYIESLAGGQKPNVLLIGHYHKAEYLPCYRNIFSLQAGCFNPRTGIRTDHGVKSIYEIKVGDMVLTHKNRYRQVSQTFRRQYGGEWVRLHFGRKNSDYSRICATPEHPVLVDTLLGKRWTPISSVEIGDIIFVLSTQCKHCGTPIPYYNKFCRKCNPAMVGARHGITQKLKLNPNSSQMRHFYKDILPYCREAKVSGRVIMPIGFIVPDAIEFINDKIILHEFENSNRPYYEKYDECPELKEFSLEDVQWHINNGLKGNTMQNWYEYDEETKMMKVPVLSKLVYTKRIEQVHNLEVEEDNSYVASNVSVHNCIQSQTPFMKRLNLAAHVGFWIVEFRVDKDNSIMRFKPEFFAHYEGRIIQKAVNG